MGLCAAQILTRYWSLWIAVAPNKKVLERHQVQGVVVMGAQRRVSRGGNCATTGGVDRHPQRE